MKSKGRTFLALVGVLAVALAGCTSFKLTGAQVTAKASSYTKVGTFDVTIWVNKFLGTSAGPTLFNIAADATDVPIYDAIQREIRKYSADAAVDVTIDYKASFVNLLLNGLTSGIYAPATAHITGTLVKYSN